MTVPLDSLNIFLDNCAIDSDSDPREKIAMDKIYRWQETGVKFILDISPSVQKEIHHPRTPLGVKSEVNKMGYTTVKLSRTEEQKKYLKQIKNILAGNGNIDKNQADAEHVFEAHINGADYFITRDTRILEKKEQLQKIHLFLLKIVKPSEFVKKYENEFRNREELSRKRFYYGSR